MKLEKIEKKLGKQRHLYYTYIYIMSISIQFKNLNVRMILRYIQINKSMRKQMIVKYNFTCIHRCKNDMKLEKNREKIEQTKTLIHMYI